MTPFLQEVASYLWQNHKSKFEDMLVVTPNRRTGIFLKNYLQQSNAGGETIWMPASSTIQEFIFQLSPLNVADNISLVFDLYDVFKKVTGTTEAFDEFLQWGQMMLSDFDDLDKYMVNTDALFTSLTDIKELESRFEHLTEEQVQTIKSFFKNFEPDKQSRLKENFLSIWHSLKPVYHDFHKLLLSKGQAYEGMVYRDAASNALDGTLPLLPYSKICFVGFNAITRCEENLFSWFANEGTAQFFWDYNPMYINNKEHEAGLFLRDFLQKFPMPENYKPEERELGDTEVFVGEAASNSGQLVQCMNWIQQKAESGVNPSRIAVVLADENLLVPALNSIPHGVNKVNVTMGYPLGETLTFGLLNLVFSLNKGIRTLHSEKVFYYKYVLPLLRHPLVKTFETEFAQKLEETIARDNIRFINPALFEESTLLSLIFSLDLEPENFTERLQNILQRLKIFILNHEDCSANLMTELEAIFHLGNALNVLQHNVFSRGVDMQLPTLIKIIQKTIGQMKIPFEGEPVEGLQVMGFLESRNLDFDHVAIVSASEEQLPAGVQGGSFVPFSLRRSFGLPTPELREAMYAYYFYRLMHRSSELFLLYNGGGGGMSSGEPSRYIHQLTYDNAFTVQRLSFSHNVNVGRKETGAIVKDQNVRSLLNLYVGEKSVRKFSPSALSTYLHCPVKFYYQNLMGIQEPEDITEEVDARLFGNLFHHSAELLYREAHDSKILLDSEALKAMANNNSFIESCVQQAFNKVYYPFTPEKQFEIEGKNNIVKQVLIKYLGRLIQLDESMAPLSISGLEYNISSLMSIQVGEKTFGVKVGGQIDRLDQTGRGTRVIDYKTGKDDLKFKELGELTNPERIDKTKAVFQTFTYCWMVKQESPETKAILPFIYQVQSFFDKEADLFTIKGEDAAFASGNYCDVHDSFGKLLQKVLEEIFMVTLPFIPTSDYKACEYCAYKTFCGR